MPDKPKKFPGYLARFLLIAASYVTVPAAFFTMILTNFLPEISKSYYGTYEELRLSKNAWISRQLPVSASRILVVFHFEIDNQFLSFDLPPDETFFSGCRLLKKDELRWFAWDHEIPDFSELTRIRKKVAENKTMNFRCHPTDDIFLAIERFGPLARTRAYIWGDFGV